MTIERIQQTVRIIIVHPWHFISLFLILGLSGIFFPFLSFFTSISLLFSMIIIPGIVLIYHADRSLISRDPVIALAGSVLISITILIAYVLICEIAGIPMTASPGLSSKAGILFQTGILLYTEASVTVTFLISRMPPDLNQPSFQTWWRNADITLPCIGILGIVAVFSVCAGVFLTVDNPEPTTELFFTPDTGGSIQEPVHTVTVTCHEGRRVGYILTIDVSGKNQTSIPVYLEDGQSYSTTVQVENETGSMKSRPAIRVRLSDDQSRQEPYREIWRQGYL